MKMAEVFKNAAEKMAALEPKTAQLSDAQMAAARTAGRTMYASGTPVHPGVVEKDFMSPVQPNPPVDITPLTAICPLKTHVVSPTVSPSEKKPLFTMDMFTPHVEKGLEAWKKEYNVSEAEFADPEKIRKKNYSI